MPKKKVEPQHEEVKCEVCNKIDKLSVSFNQEDLNLVVAKINEIIEKI